MSGSTLRVPRGTIKKKRIRGRGSGTGRGGKCGKGNKGQNARSGGGVRLGFEGGQMPLYRRIARRGFSNARFKTIYAIVNVGDLEKKYSGDETVNRDSLYGKGMISKKAAAIKVLGNGELTKKLVVAVDKVSQNARDKILKAGGEIPGTEDTLPLKKEPEVNNNGE
jgi:large subunit ribosomal protein L15